MSLWFPVEKVMLDRHKNKSRLQYEQKSDLIYSLGWEQALQPWSMDQDGALN